MERLRTLPKDSGNRDTYLAGLTDVSGEFSPSLSFTSDRKRLGAFGTAAMFLATGCFRVSGGAISSPIRTESTGNPGITEAADAESEEAFSCTINLSPDNQYRPTDPIDLSVDFPESVDPNSDHRVILLYQWSEFLMNSDRTIYNTSELEAGIQLDGEYGYSTGNYSIDVIEKATDFPLEDEGESCSSEIYIDPKDGKPEPSIATTSNGEISDEHEYYIRDQDKKYWGVIFSLFLEENDGVHKGRPVILRWLDTLGIPEEAITAYENTNELLDNPTDITSEFFRIIPNTGETRPREGDIIIIRPTGENERGEIGVAMMRWFNYIEDEYFLTSYAARDRISIDRISAWMRPKQNDSPLPDLIYVFVKTSETKIYEHPVTVWFETLGIPMEAAMGYNSAEEMIQNPTEITKQFFEIIPYERGVIPHGGDIFLYADGGRDNAGVVVDSGVHGGILLNSYLGGDSIDDFDNAYALLRPRLINGVQNPDTITITDGESEEGEVLGARTGSTLNLRFPFDGTWYYTGGPHTYTEKPRVITAKIRPELDFAPPEVTSCKNNAGAVAENDWVTASESGEVIAITDPGKIIARDNKGFDITYEHIDVRNDLRKGDVVEEGEQIGNPGCFGNTTGIHVDISVSKDGQSIPAKNLIFSGYTVGELPENYDGTLTKGNEIITADTRRCGPSQESIDACGGIRNDVSNSTEDLSTIPEFVAETPLDATRYELAKYVLEYLKTPSIRVEGDSDSDTWYKDLNQQLSLSENEIEQLAQTLAVGTETSDPVSYRWDTKLVYGDSGERQLGDLTFNNLRIELYDPNPYAPLPTLSPADEANGMVWKGNLTFSGIAKAGIRDEQAYGSYSIKRVKDWLAENPNFESIRSYSNWFDIERLFHVTVWRNEDGSIGSNISCVDPVDLQFEQYYGDRVYESCFSQRDKGPVEAYGFFEIFYAMDRGFRDAYEEVEIDLTP